MQQIDHTKSIIEVNNVSYTYGGPEFAVKDVSFNIHKGDYLGVIGPNGGGKTTLLRLMLGLLTPTKGRISMFGHDLQTFRDWYKIGYVPQKATFVDPNFPITVEEVVSMGTYAKRGLFRFPTGQDHKHVHDALAQVEMLPFKKRLIGDLSGGQQQRVFIARALAAEPEVIFLDEPTVGVDTTTQEQFYLLLRKLNRKLDLTLILVLHELDVIAREATEIVCINGSLVSYCTPEELAKPGGIEKLYGKDLKYILHDHGGTHT